MARIQQVTHCYDLGPLSFDSYRFVPILSHFDCDSAGGTPYHDCNLFGSDSYQFVLILSSFSLIWQVPHCLVTCFFFCFFFKKKNISTPSVKTSLYYIFQGFQRRFSTRKKMKTEFTIHILIILFFFFFFFYKFVIVINRFFIDFSFVLLYYPECHSLV